MRIVQVNFKAEFKLEPKIGLSIMYQCTLYFRYYNSRNTKVMIKIPTRKHKHRSAAATSAPGPYPMLLK